MYGFSVLPECSYLARTSPEDVARVESKTYICTDDERQTRAIPKEGVKSILANWRDQKEMRKEIKDKFDGCMKGTYVRTYIHSCTMYLYILIMWMHMYVHDVNVCIYIHTFTHAA